MLLSCRLHGHQVLLIPSLPSFRARRPWLVDGRVETSRATSAPGPGSPRPQLRRDRAHPVPHLHRGWAGPTVEHQRTQVAASTAPDHADDAKVPPSAEAAAAAAAPIPTLREPSLPAAPFALSVRPGGRPGDGLTPKSPECPVTSVGEYYTGLLRRTKEAAHQTCFRRFTVVDARAHTHPPTHTPRRTPFAHIAPRHILGSRAYRARWCYVRTGSECPSVLAINSVAGNGPRFRSASC